MKDPEPNAPLLNVPQRRHFEVFLSQLQDALVEVEILSTPSDGRTDALITYDDDLAPGFAKRMHPLLESLRDDIADLARLLEVKPTRRSRVRLVRALITAEVIRLDDSYAAKVRGYGAVNPAAGATIDPILDRIRADLTGLLRASAEVTESAPGADAQ
jgi:hypothetical protein